MDKHWWELFYALPEAEQYDIDMDLYDEFNNDYCATESDFYEDIYGISSKQAEKELKREESMRRKILTKQKVIALLKQAESKKQREWAIDKIIDEEMEKRK